jgi:isoleucyl-tRNA synthetase
LSGDAEKSVMLETWQPLPAQTDESELVAKWALIRNVRGEVTKALEDLRIEGKIGAPLQADVLLHVDGEKFDALASLGDDLKYVFIVSSASVIKSAEEKVVATPLTHAKCERCWHVREDVGTDTDHPDLCGRCVSNLFGEGEARGLA